MGSFANNAITDRGRVLLAEIQAGALLDATRIVMGSGFLASGVNPHNITAVVSPVKSLDINKKQQTLDGKAIFGAVYTNRDVTEPFYFRELALYARPLWLAEDGTVVKEGDEVLYSYGNAGSAADLMPAYSTNTVVEKQIDLVTWVGNDAHISLSIESGIYASEKMLADHTSDGEVHVQAGERAGWQQSVDTAEAAIAATMAASQQLNLHDARIARLEDGLFSNITGNPFLVSFNSLVGISLMKGIWNAERQRLEC